MIDMVKKSVIPAVLGYENELMSLVSGKKALSVSCSLEENLLDKISRLSDCMYQKLGVLENAVLGADEITDTQELGTYHREQIFMNMQNLRETVDELETMVSSEYWTLPTYGEMLYSVI